MHEVLLDYAHTLQWLGRCGYHCGDDIIISSLCPSVPANTSISGRSVWVYPSGPGGARLPLATGESGGNDRVGQHYQNKPTTPPLHCTAKVRTAPWCQVWGGGCHRDQCQGYCPSLLVRTLTQSLIGPILPACLFPVISPLFSDDNQFVALI